jgi:hypothetical protein
LSPAEILADKQAITEVLYQYCYAMDRIDRQLGYDVWHADGLARYEGIFEGTGREFVDWVLDRHRTFGGTSHQVTNIMIDLDGDRASSEAYVTTCNRVGDKDIVSRGRYLDTWSRRDGRWRIDVRRFETDVTQVIPVAGAG